MKAVDGYIFDKIEYTEIIINGVLRERYYKAPMTDKYGRMTDCYNRDYRMRVCHNYDGPADEKFHPNGKIRSRCWVVLGNFHRIDGPAIIEWNESGRVVRSSWYYNSIDITSQIRGIIKKYKLPHWTRWTNEHKMLVKLCIDI